jgi:putative membrane protein
MVFAYWHMHNMGAGGWVLMTLGWVLIVGLLIWALLSLVRRRAGDRHQATAPEILDRRLADGAISVEEYERLHHAMHAKPGHP